MCVGMYTCVCRVGVRPVRVRGHTPFEVVAPSKILEGPMDVGWTHTKGVMTQGPSFPPLSPYPLPLSFLSFLPGPGNTDGGMCKGTSVVGSRRPKEGLTRD